MSTLHELKIEKMTLGGQSIGYIDGKVCFVNRVVPGELVLAEIIQEKEDYTIANAREVLVPSPFRIKPSCPVYNRCGGCQLQHIAYEHQIELKKSIFIETLKRIGKLETVINGFFHGEPWNYRNRTQIPVQNNRNLKIGYYQSGTHKVIDHNACLINNHVINELVQIVRKRIIESKIAVYNERNGKGNLRHIIIKAGSGTGQVFISFVTREKDVPVILYRNLNAESSNIVGITQNINPERSNRILGDIEHLLWGKTYYEEKIDDLLFRISPMSFFQISTTMLMLMLKTIRQELVMNDNDTVLDLYAGVGVIGIYLANSVRDVIAIESNPHAVKDGNDAIKLNHLKNVRFEEGTVESKITALKDVRIVILDPPRKGAAEMILEKIKEIEPSNIVYISCNPATFARDAKRLQNRNYKISKLFLFDMFPQTYHVESLAFFEKA